MSDFIEWMNSVGKTLLRNPGEDTLLSSNTLKSTSIQKEFDNFVKRHYMIDTTDYISMLVAKQSYNSPSMREIFIDNRTVYQPSLSTDRIAVYIRGYQYFRTMYIGIHGTKITSIEDLYQDSRLMVGMVKDTAITTKYLIDIMNIVTQSGIPRDNIYISGHSLGAYYALLSGFILKANVRTFNGVNEILSISRQPNDVIIGNMEYSTTGMNTYRDSRSYRMFGDPISLLNKWTLPNTVTIRVDNMSVNPLTLHSIDYMTEVCIPEIPLDKRDVTRARRFNRMPLRNEMMTEGTEFQQLQEEAEENVYKRLIKILSKNN